MENLEQSNNKNVSLSLIAEYDSESEAENTKSNENPNNDDSEPVELSEMVLKNNIINACAHGPLSSTSNEEVTRHMIIDSCENDVLEYDVTEYRDVDSSESSSDESSESDVDSVKDVEELTSGDEVEGGKTEKSGPKVRGELGLDDLPPIEDLAISLPAQETTKIGIIASVVDRLVVVRAYPETPAVDLDSVLFLDNGAKALGKVFDVFGPVTEPHYCVRFNSEAHARERGAAPGREVYIAPRTSHTSYVFLSQLMTAKGSDASWLHDIEPPPGHVEYSDDEEERKANKTKKEQKYSKKHQHKQEQANQNKQELDQNKQEQDQNKQSDAENGEPSNPPPRKMLEAKRNRPAQSSSRFGPNRGRMPVGFRRNPGFVRGQRPHEDQNMRIPPPHPNDMSQIPPFNPQTLPPFNPQTVPPFAPQTMSPFNPQTLPPFNPQTLPPFNPQALPPFHQPYATNMFNFGAPPMRQMPPTNWSSFRPNAPVLGDNFCNIPGPHPQWTNDPPPPGT